jgi:hypothetical protein
MNGECDYEEPGWDHEHQRLSPYLCSRDRWHCGVCGRPIGHEHPGHVS